MANTRRIIIKNVSTKERMVLDVNPASFTFSCPQNNVVYNLIGGDYSRMGAKGAMTCSMEVLLPHDDAWYKTSSESQEEQLLKLYAWKNDKACLKLYVQGALTMLVYLTGMDVTVSEGDKDMTATLSFVQRRKLKKTKA
ncbi:MAG: hypothetical protein ACLRXL_02055 [Christensenellaceae bacterium]